MGREIHPSAIIQSGAELGEGVTVGPYAIIESNVTVDNGSTIGSHCLIASGARIGKNVKIHHGAVVGTFPQDLKFGGEESTAEIGDNTVIREYVTVNRATKHSRRTVVGSDCLLMAYVHVAHDCKVGDRVIVANAANMGGHVTIGDWAIIGGMVPIHQFVRIGRHIMIGGGFRAMQDLCPFGLFGGYPLRVVGINQIGLHRRGFSEDTIRAIRQAYKIIFFGGLNTTQALKRIADEMAISPEISEIVDFVRASERGIVK